MNQSKKDYKLAILALLNRANLLIEEVDQINTKENQSDYKKASIKSTIYLTIMRNLTSINKQVKKL